ncbi:T6SS phospholipase effector Tle1-like catalytic domain-containing protein [Roseimaritima ulvae]|uniref:T6SS Phospholipase effector Tle1-like catalytic domain-containing protein n=1 Tax=Roseimaritima ulvae TaxID=980254 RepID=A0A5B9QW11_9BACT|nr:DUF2235 domain-containing protein [Roseimaritima ulvae]QEG38123.1 hypothetical protein UC8_00760 [Roseimaritima ulvae]
MAKNIVVCCDGTGNQFSVDKTNVLRLHDALCKDDPTQQVAFYAPGVGTFSPSMAWTRPGRAFGKLMGLALGIGYRQTIEDAYWFIVENYEPGDRICLFGFSRGAYTARVVAALLHGVGVLQRGNRHLVRYALAEIELHKRDKLKFQHLGRFRKQFSQSFAKKPFIFLGLWDTVSSVSWAYDYLRYAFTASNRSVDVVRHAVSIDERRAFYSQNLFSRREGQDFKEVWFAGVHSDVGGGYPEDESGLAKIALEWMLVQARDFGGVLLDEARVERVLADGCAPNHRGVLHRSLTWKWWPAEFFPKQRYPSPLPRPHLFRRRRLAARFKPGADPPKCRIHESVIERKKEGRLNYQPSNWPSEFEVESRVRF